MSKMWGGSVKGSTKKVKKEHHYKDNHKKNKKLSSCEVSETVFLLSNKFFLESSRSMGKWIDSKYTKNAEMLTDEEIDERLRPYNGPYAFDWNKKIKNKFKGGR